MGGRGSSDFVETVRSAADIVPVISDYVPLKPAGTRLKGLCPFHQEKTPSFSVDPSNQLFYCFGCQTGGDVFKFVMLYEKVGFREALEGLAKRYGVPIPERRPVDRRQERALGINEEADAFYRGFLADEGGSACRVYLAERGLDDATIEQLGLGCAPDRWDGLRTHLLAKRYSEKELLEAGLVLERRDGRGSYDRFRNRLIFPIRDLQGRVIAFGGRILGDGEPKYLNSPESPTYTKGNHLYGLDLARDAIRREGYAILVEGYLDLAALTMAGFGNVVAALGTALTPVQVQLLARFTERVVVAFDGDAAGARATLRSLDLMLERGFDVRVVELGEGMDPDDCIRSQGADEFRRRVDEAPGYLEFLIRREARGRDLEQTGEQVAAVNAVLPHVARLGNAIERASWAGRLADALRIDDRLVLQELESSLRGGRTGLRQRIEREEGPIREVEARLVSLMLTDPEGRRRAVEELTPDDLHGTRVAGIVRTILEVDADAGEVDYQHVFAALERDGDKDLLTRIAFREEPAGTVQEVEDCLRSLRRQRLVRERRRIQSELRSVADPGAVDDLLLRTQELARQIDLLS